MKRLIRNIPWLPLALLAALAIIYLITIQI